MLIVMRVGRRDPATVFPPSESPNIAKMYMYEIEYVCVVEYARYSQCPLSVR